MSSDNLIKRGFSFLANNGYPLPLRFKILFIETARRVFHCQKKYAPLEITDSFLLGRLNGFKTVKEYTDHLRSRQKPAFFIFSNQEEKRDFALNFDVLYPEKKQEIIKSADTIISHTFDLLGSGPQNLSLQASSGGYQPINWHSDFKSGFTWDKNTYYKDIRYGWQPGVDIKIPWELSRCQHFPTLGKAYLLTGDEKYAHEFVNQIDDWIANNRAGYGVNWVCTMDVAIRSVNWLWGFYFFRNSPALSDNFINQFIKSLYQHGLYIMGNLEKDSLGHNSNHYLSNLAGLVYLGIFFSDIKEARRWRDYAVKELIFEAGRQLYPDGADYEGSTSYHRLVTEIFFSASLLCRDNGIVFPDWYWKRIEKALEFTAFYTKPDGKAPQIGDNDNGRLHILADYGTGNLTDHRYLLSLGAPLFSNTLLKQASGGFHEEAFCMIGMKGHEKYAELAASPGPLMSQKFPDSGYYILRHGYYHMIVDALNTNPHAPSGHRHNSRLSFELYAGDKTFLTDPGTYLYTPDPEMRNLFRSTAYHNTVVVDGEEQEQIFTDSLFRMGQSAHVKILKWQTTESHDILILEHHGYRRLSNPVTHRRQIYFNKLENYWLVHDILEGSSNHHYDLYFHFTPLEVLQDQENALIVKTNCSGKNLAIIPIKTNGISLEITSGWVSPGYGLKQQSPVIKYSQNGQCPMIFSNLLYPFQGKLDVKSITEKLNMLDFNIIFGSEP